MWLRKVTILGVSSVLKITWGLQPNTHTSHMGVIQNAAGAHGKINLCSKERKNIYTGAKLDEQLRELKEKIR